MGILDSIVEWIATQVMNLLDLITGSVLGALGCDMSTFLRYFPAAETLYEIFVAIGVGFILTSLLAACRLSSPMRTPESGSVVSSSRFAKSMVKFSGPIPPTATASSASPTQRVAGIPSLSARRKTDTHSIPRLSMHASRIARLRRLRSPTSAWPLS